MSIQDLKIIFGDLLLLPLNSGEEHACIFLDTSPNPWVERPQDMFHVLEQGDLLTVFDKAAQNVIWQGKIDLEPTSKYVGNRQVLGLQKGMPPEEWTDMFINSQPATLLRVIPRPK